MHVSVRCELGLSIITEVSPGQEKNCSLFLCSLCSQSQIDRHVELLRSNLEKVLQRLQDRLPGAVRWTKAE
ncbi:hypothetical protein ILYODFUR_037873 [Ilyodon furcidens]|uniref:Uncharacterized protein n=3 Tax=Goodeidae TaxID=28758 RepID=A0ABU7DJQ2_9TELE|nr:hypothetical protein [Characodon lateralis]